MSSEAEQLTVSEGKATICFPGSKGVFYNPVQEFNRDLSIAVLRQFAIDRHYEQLKKDVNNETSSIDLQPGIRHEDGLYILEALAASGLRSVRFAKEIGGVREIVANDLSHLAVETMKKNIEHNSVSGLVTPSEEDASLLMYQHRSPPQRFHVVDLDPYGSPTMFLDAAVQCVADGGLLLVTATDMAVLCGNSPETCYVKYGATALRTKSCHEMALRILLQCISRHANRYGRYIHPVISVSVDFYVRVVVQIFTSAVRCKETTSKLSMVYQCVGCETRYYQPLGKTYMEKGQKKYKLDSGPPVGRTCDHCGHSLLMGGPIWMAPIHDTGFVSCLLHSPDNMDLKTWKRMEGVLSMICEELQDVPLYVQADQIMSTVKCSVPNLQQFRSALLHGGYRVSLSHTNPQSVKTDAPPHVIWDIARCWFREIQKDINRLPEGSPGRNIAERKPLLKANFETHPDANPESREKQLLRFQVNPEKYWGPKARAHMRSEGDEKRKRNQGKNSQKRKQKEEVDDGQKKQKGEEASSSAEESVSE